MRATALMPISAGPGRSHEVGDRIPDGSLSDAELARLAAMGAVELAETADDRSGRIQAALADVPDAQRTKDGKPGLAWLRDRAGLPDVTGAERDREWKLAQAG